MEAYGNYLKLAAENDELAEGGIIDPKKFKKYQWFVSYCLNACEEVLEVKKKDKKWQKCVETEIGYHST